MTNTLQIFENHNFGSIRTVLDESGKALFCGKDIAEALGYSNPLDAITRHCRAIVKRDTPISGKIQAINFIPEGDVYRLIISSKLPSAEKFERWVFDEVLPTIMHEGNYSVKKNSELPDFSNPAKAARAWADQYERATALEMYNKANEPKVAFANAVSVSNDLILIRELAKILKQNGIEIGEKRLYERLRDDGYLIKSGADKNSPTQKSMELKLFEVLERCTHNNPAHAPHISFTTKVTAKGQQYFVNRYCGKGAN